jgi:hypothetical protein
MWWKSRVLMFSLCLQLLLLLTTFSLGKAAKAEGKNTEGFIIMADQVVGSGMQATLVRQETADNNSKPMLRIQYKRATIYGMKLTKQVETPKGAVSITLSANGPVTVKDMTVDTTALSFTGACLKASETIPELGMENVIMVGHYMSSTDSVIEKLVLNTVSGNTIPSKPGKLKILEDLSLLPVNQLEKEIERISSGHLPLTCEGKSSGDEKGSIGEHKNPIKDVIAVVTNPLEPVTKPLEPIIKPLEPILKPLEPIIKPLEPILKPLEPILTPIVPALEPLHPVVGEVGYALKSTCEKIKDSNGVITKEFALNLIDEAIEKNLTLSTICKSDTLVVAVLQKWEKGLLKTLGLIELLGKLTPNDPIQKLYQIREYITKQPDGAIIYKP